MEEADERRVIERIGALDRILAHVTSSGKAWIAPRMAIAKHWRATFPAT